ncbi:MAG: S1 RNA-binding domain-containing protein, partial [Candidatus Atribacteria bacterium]|nr:S1 RNA-binding domain-containing protein [Candidatus Atribacteria bacterium]
MELNNKNEAEKKENKSTEGMLEMINESLEKFKKIKRGDIIKGKIIKVNEDGYLVDMKYKMEGYLPKNEPSLFSKEGG